MGKHRRNWPRHPPWRNRSLKLIVPPHSRSSTPDFASSSSQKKHSRRKCPLRFLERFNNTSRQNQDHRAPLHARNNWYHPRPSGLQSSSDYTFAMLPPGGSNSGFHVTKSRVQPGHDNYDTTPPWTDCPSVTGCLEPISANCRRQLVEPAFRMTRINLTLLFSRRICTMKQRHPTAACTLPEVCEPIRSCGAPTHKAQSGVAN
ncbi:hypothetical protein B0H66DRAFT_395697 [Apodospora peruviana]|uniref:Uncharacterized protein n=1 Tax=Apodospora peruviana TaxID=516989 RepID=A0AAE0HSS3_9PEZI|nr:hypothetical protein B0H66DRAFT_395697 [Apodospora peruviana]